MGRKSSVGKGNPKRQSTLSPAIIHRRIESSKISHLSSDEIAEHIYSAYPDYKHYKLIPFRTKLRQILQHSRRPPFNFAPEDNNHDDDDDDEEEEGEEGSELRSPLRKKQRQVIDERERKLVRRETTHLQMRRRDNSSVSLSSSTSVSTSEDSVYGEEVAPEFDLMKSMLRAGYGDAKSTPYSKSKQKEVGISGEESNLEVEDVRTEKKIGAAADALGRGEKSLSTSASRVVEEGELKGGVSGPRFKDFGGMKKILDELMMEIMVPLYHPQLPQWLGVKPMSGILLHGPPGCGKTQLARAIANETGVPFYQISATEVVSGVSGASEENIRDLFAKAHKTAPSIVFIDEIDAIASKRENLQREMERRIVTQLLTCMDESHSLVKSNVKQSDSDANVDNKSGYVLVIGATNRPDAVDSALRRPGRFDREIALGVPNEDARLEILSILTQNIRLAGDFDLIKIAKATPGFVGADLVALANKAGNLAMQRIIDERRLHLSEQEGEIVEEWWKEPWSPGEMKKLSITMTDFEEAAKMVQPSSRREGFSAIPDVKWEDVGGLNMLRKEFELYIVNRIKYPMYYEESGVDLESGFLLYGPPGCGKTLIAKAVANEAGANFIHIKGPELLNKYVGESELQVRTIFNRARTCAPCIIFFDEVDALTTERGKEGGWVVERLLNQLLIELNGGDHRREVFVIGATNRPGVIDSALLRPGRFGKFLYVPLPDPDERGLILKALARTKPIDCTVDLLDLGKREACENLSGADLAALMNEAAMAALEEKMRSPPSTSDAPRFSIKSEHFEQAMKKVTPSVSAKQKQYYEKLSQTFQAA